MFPLSKMLSALFKSPRLDEDLFSSRVTGAILVPPIHKRNEPAPFIHQQTFYTPLSSEKQALFYRNL